MSVVYAPHVPARRDSGSGIWTPTIDLAPAREFGDIVEMLPRHANRAQIAPCLKALHAALKNFTRDDFIIAVGDPTLIGAACVIAAQKTNGYLRMLRWDRRDANYSAVEMQL